MILRRILIANRGEIAVRIIRTCQQLGIETVLAASEADLNSMAARQADITICIGPPPADDSYLNVEAVIAGAVSTAADAIHPGYGFLAENRKLAQACTKNNIVFIGPTEAQLDAVGDKLKAREHAIDTGLRVVPGGEVRDVKQAQELTVETGWPILLKAVCGGGGRGLKIVSDRQKLAATLDLAIAEAQAAFGDPRIYLERYVTSGRHVEVQIIGDGTDVIHLGDRDCSIQRRYQKLVEEAPAPNLDDELRGKMHQAAVDLGRHLKYRSLGTVELLLDCARNTFYFLEMNARIQVEHPVTEAVCGLDLVKEQIAVAQGQPLSIKQKDVRLSGHAIECRINAEDWRRDFLPSPGTITRAVFPAGKNIRVDTHIQAGATVPPFYDSLLAKLIVHGADRAEALARLRRALDQIDIRGVVSNVPMHAALMGQEAFAEGGVDASFFPRFLNKQLKPEIC